MHAASTDPPHPSKQASAGDSAYTGSHFAEVWNAVLSDRYARLPQHRIGVRDILSWGTLRRIHASARRTLRSREDLLPPFDKLAHPLGICLRGTWHITEPSEYTGYFRQGTKALLIARASENMGETRPGHLRFLALAGKLFPTDDPDHAQPLRTANFLMNESLFGSHTRHYVDAVLETDLLPVELRGEVGVKVVLAAVVGAVFAVADRVTSATQSLVRQLYPIAELGEPPAARTVAPAVMRFVGAPENRRVDTPDFREELKMEHHPGGIRYEIQAASRRSYFKKQEFVRLGEVCFVESVASCTCDHRLHFRHAPFRHE